MRDGLKAAHLDYFAPTDLAHCILSVRESAVYCRVRVDLGNNYCCEIEIDLGDAKRRRRENRKKKKELLGQAEELGTQPAS